MKFLYEYKLNFLPFGSVGISVWMISTAGFDRRCQIPVENMEGSIMNANLPGNDAGQLHPGNPGLNVWLNCSSQSQWGWDLGKEA